MEYARPPRMGRDISHDTMAHGDHLSHRKFPTHQLVGTLSAEDGGEKTSYQLSDSRDQLWNVSNELCTGN
jgi:hypothetical protein